VLPENFPHAGPRKAATVEIIRVRDVDDEQPGQVGPAAAREIGCDRQPDIAARVRVEMHKDVFQGHDGFLLALSIRAK
jgi:hypothetical protein